jgi:hypothetical protein
MSSHLYIGNILEVAQIRVRLSSWGQKSLFATKPLSFHIVKVLKEKLQKSKSSCTTLYYSTPKSIQSCSHLIISTPHHIIPYHNPYATILPVAKERQELDYGVSCIRSIYAWIRSIHSDRAREKQRFCYYYHNE